MADETHGNGGAGGARLAGRYLYPLVLVFVSVLALSVSGVIYTNRVAEAEGRKLCSVFTLLDGAYRQAPPTTPTGQRFAAAIHRVVTDLGCS